MAPPRQEVKARDAASMSKVGERYNTATVELERASTALDASIKQAYEDGYNVSAIARSMEIGRNVVYRSLERSGIGADGKKVVPKAIIAEVKKAAKKAPAAKKAVAKKAPAKPAASRQDKNAATVKKAAPRKRASVLAGK